MGPVRVPVVMAPNNSTILTNSLTPRGAIALAFIGVSTLVGGLAFAFRGKSLGPIVVIPGALGVAMLVIVTALLYPVRWLSKGGPNVRSPDR